MSATAWWMPSKEELIRAARYEIATLGAIRYTTAEDLRTVGLVPEQVEQSLRDFFSNLPPKEEIDDGA